MKEYVVGAAGGIGIGTIVLVLAFAGLIDSELQAFADWVEEFVNAGG